MSNLVTGPGLNSTPVCLESVDSQKPQLSTQTARPVVSLCSASTTGCGAGALTVHKELL